MDLIRLSERRARALMSCECESQPNTPRNEARLGLMNFGESK
jgi:hypothetical protein